MRNRKPEHGDYDYPHKENEIKGANIELSKMVGRDAIEELDSEEEKEGDMLILDPEKPGRRLQNIQFEKQLGRPDNDPHEEDDIEGDVLDLEPRQLEKKMPDFKFENMVVRDKPAHYDDDQDVVIDFEDDPIPNNPKIAKVTSHNFGLGPDRFNNDRDKLNEDMDFGDNEVFLDPQPLERKLKGTVFMDRGEERFKEKLNQDPFYAD